MKQMSYQQKILALPVAVAIASLLIQPVVSAEFDEDFYSGNNILYYNPEDTVACAATASGMIGKGTPVPKDFSLGTGVPERPVNLMKHLMNDYGLTPEQAAGVVGNFMEESWTKEAGDSLPPNVNQGGVLGPPSPNYSGGNAYGWAQWDGDRKKSFVDFAVKNGYMASANVSATDAANYAYLKHELETEGSTESKAIPAVKKTQTVSDAVIQFETFYERAGEEAYAVRIEKANKVLSWYSGGGAPTGPTTPGGASLPDCTSGGASIVGSLGETVFPLAGGKSAVKNPEIFRNGTTNKAGHPYTAFDIYADPGTPVLAFISGTVKRISSDVCNGRLLTVYNQEHDIAISYMHLSTVPSTHAKEGDTLAPGDRLGEVGSANLGCGTPHLHIDAIQGSVRYGCSRQGCSDSVESMFVDIGPDLYKAYNAQG